MKYSPEDIIRQSGTCSCGRNFQRCVVCGKQFGSLAPMSLFCAVCGKQYVWVALLDPISSSSRLAARPSWQRQKEALKLELAFLGQVTRLCLQFYVREVEMVDQQPKGLVSPQRFFFYWQRTPHHGGTTAELSSKLSRVLCGHVSFQNLSTRPLAACKHCNFSTAVQKAKSAKSCKQTCSPNCSRSNKAMLALRGWLGEWEEGGVVTQGGQQAQAVLSQPCQSFQGSASTDPSIIFFD